jgi:hypothetical protein
VLNHKSEDDTCTQYYLVESKTLPAERSGFKTELQDGETFESDFIGASPEECKAWTREKQFQVNFIEQDILAILDARSAQDKTIVMSCYICPEMCEPPRMIFPPFGILPRPQDANTWSDYRIEYPYGSAIVSFWNFCGPVVTYPALLGKKEDFTDEHGVFDVAGAERFCVSYNPDEYFAGPPRL